MVAMKVAATVLSLAGLVASAPVNDEITSLPGWEGTLPSKWSVMREEPERALV